jgi:hypothetical protein
MSGPHLVVSITGHGFGHVAQTAPVLNQLFERVPDLRLTIRSAVPLSHLRSRIHVPFAHLPGDGDIGMVMSSALDVLVADSRAAYRALHADWEARVDAEARLLTSLGADAVLSNVGYLPLAGAQRIGLPNAAMCSLNWFDIYRHYCGDDSISAQIHACYAGADAFLRVTPGMKMDTLENLVPVGPVAFIGRNRRDELNRRLELSKDDKLVLVSMGGINSRFPVENWPRIKGVRWIVQKNWNVDHPDCIVLETLPMEFGDLLASSDALLCKPGYGSFVEAACSSTPVMYVDRPDWPEAPALIEWLKRSGASIEVSRAQLESGDFATALPTLWSAKQPAPPLTAGTGQITDWLMRRLSLAGD